MICIMFTVRCIIIIPLTFRIIHFYINVFLLVLYTNYVNQRENTIVVINVIRLFLVRLDNLM